MEKPTNGKPRYDVWAYGLPGENELAGRDLDVQLMRRAAQGGGDTLIYKVPVKLHVLSVQPRRRVSGAPGSTHRELAVEVEMVENAQRGAMNSFDDGQGLSAFKAGERFTLVYWPSDRMARVSRSCAILQR